MNAMAREAARAERGRIAAARRAEREDDRRARQAVRDAKEAAKEAKQRYLDSRLAEADERMTELSARQQSLAELLEHTLRVEDTISFDSLKMSTGYPDIRMPAELDIRIVPPPPPELPAAGWLTRTLPWLRRAHETALAKATAAHQAAVAAAHDAEADRENRVAALRSAHETARATHMATANARNEEVDELARAYRSGEADAVATYVTMVLERSEYPEGFPQAFRVAYVPASKELVVEYELPSVAIVPKIAEFKYVRARDVIDEKVRKQADVARDYREVVASVVLRTLHEVFESDQADVISVAAFNGMVQTIDPATGRDIRACIISVRATKAEFLNLDLRRVDKQKCLRNLGAHVSSRPDEVMPVKPIVEFDMVDKRFIEQGDAMGGLDSRPNLMDLTPGQFENLVSNLFQKMGLDTKLTRTSRDGGVDAVAFDTRPIVGGKVVIQAKRYRHTVGVSAVRDLYGTMMNEGANKGILVATSGYGPDAFAFAKDKPIELIAGGGLLYLLEQVGVRATIVMPPEAV